MLLERCYLPAAPACLKCKSWLSPWPRRYSWTVWRQAPPGNPIEQSELASERGVGGRAWWVSWGAPFTQQQGKKPCVPINVKRNGTFNSQHSTARVYPVLHEGLSPRAALPAAVVVTRLGSMRALSLISRVARCSFIFFRAAGLLKLYGSCLQALASPAPPSLPATTALLPRPPPAPSASLLAP